MKPADQPTLTAMRVVRWWDSLPRATRIVMVVLPVTMAALAAWAFGEVVGQHHHQFDLRLYYDAINFWQSGHDLYSYSQPDPVNITLGFTYPPVAALLMSPMGLLSYPVVLVVSLAAIICSAAVFVYLVLRERIRLPKPLMFAVAGVATAFAFTLEPFRQTLSFGQINIYLGLLVLVDLLVLGRRGSKWTGVGIGLATAIKLTPGIFIIYLLVVGRWRAALTAIGTIVGVNLLSALIAPSETWRYFTSLMWETSRVGFLDTTTNQSINGLLARLDAPFAPARLPWLILAVAVLVFGFWRARRAALGGDELAAITITGLVGVLVSPVSWVHHIVWLFPAMAILAMRVLTAIRALADDDSGYASTDRTLQTRIVRAVGYSVLLTTGLAIWCMPTAALINVRDGDYDKGGALLAFAGSVQLLWMIVVLFALPIEKWAAKPAPVDLVGSSPLGVSVRRFGEHLQGKALSAEPNQENLMAKSLPKYTVPSMTVEQGAEVAAVLQERLNALNDLALTLKHIHWNVVGPHFIAVHEMLDPQVDTAREYADELAERIATLGSSAVGTPGALVKARTWDDYSIGRDDAIAHLGALDVVYQGIISDYREAAEAIEDADPVSNDLLIGHLHKLELYHWFVRAHLESSSGSLSTNGAAKEKVAAAKADAASN